MKSVCCRLLVIILVGTAALAAPAVARAAATTAVPAGKGNEALETEKLAQEVANLKLQNDSLRSPWTKLSANAAFMTAVVALLGVFVTIRKQQTENRRQRELDREQRERDREQRGREEQQEIDRKFASILADLGAEREAIQAGAAVSIVTFLEPEYRRLHEQIFAVLLANLKIAHSEAVNQLIVAAFEKAVRQKLARTTEAAEPFVPDFARATLNQADLADLDLTGADLGFTQLRLANLSGAVLFRVRGYEVNLEKARLSRANLNEARLQHAHLNDAYLHECNLVAADLKGAELRGAEFQQAKLQAAHLEGADLTGARFEQANVSDAYFLGAKFDARALKSLSRAVNWQKAHLDGPVREQLEELARG
ncbi:hypothetical protein GURASL_25100 [Geotalea uraniireducens]|uniref:Pentapeptide repeat-containing protein n=1 Tax=Geotalea uraniireducens TaxID=351604 RepID=A0ABM8EMD3_9BACT|nr:pentapeptide repeat-containing protein [Geotalea uraniireducens]BDV43587.1 hypothetical protein GURASL_25100 [Geotalea uraniireducens]